MGGGKRGRRRRRRFLMGEMNEDELCGCSVVLALECSSLGL